ncbi:MAG TPA: YihY/virulence factor BrkB family protein, partial [Candidatus Lustribacter sp.]|nr:YihY/virulence factor BrkB family protein [Candidatus Lustribacter sp.]
MSGLKRLRARLQATRAMRSWKRFGDARGNILAAGVAYFAFFSVFPAVTLAFTVFGLVLRGNEPLRQSLTESLSTALPGVIKSSPTSSGLIEITAPSATALTITGLVGVVTLMLAGAGWLGALRAGIRAMLGVAGTPGNMLTTKLRDLGVLVGLGLALLVSIVATTGAVSAAALVSQVLGEGESPVLVTAVGLLVSAAVDVGVMVLLLRVLSGVSLPWPDVRQGRDTPESTRRSRT